MPTYHISCVLPGQSGAVKHTVFGDAIHHGIGIGREGSMQTGDLADGGDGTDIVVENNGDEVFALCAPSGAIVTVETED